MLIFALGRCKRKSFGI